MNTNVETLIARTSNGTPVYSHPEAHPHRLDLAAEGISKMVIPAAPADPADRSQTRHCEVVDFGRAIGVNHRTELKEDMRTFYMIREGHDYPSLMTIDGMPTIETRTTNVCFWDADNSCWVFWTNHEGAEDPYPEPGSDRFNHLPEKEKKKAIAWHHTHPLICTAAEIQKAKNEGLIKAEYFFHIGEDELPYSPTQQPWCKWEKEIGPFETKEEAEKERKAYLKKMSGDREWVYGVFDRYQKTWYDEAKRKASLLKISIEDTQSIIKRMEKDLAEETAKYEEMKVVIG